MVGVYLQVLGNKSDKTKIRLVYKLRDIYMTAA